MSPQVLVHTLVVWVFKLLLVHHHLGGVWERERAAHNSLEKGRKEMKGEKGERRGRKKERGREGEDIGKVHVGKMIGGGSG